MVKDNYYIIQKILKYNSGNLRMSFLVTFIIKSGYILEISY